MKTIKKLVLKMMTWMIGDTANPGTLKRRLGQLFLRHFPGQITCQEFEAFIVDFVDDDLAPNERKLFNFHMTICPMCNVHFSEYRRTIELSQKVCEADDENLPADVPEELVAAILTARAVR